jgi:1-deoxy-D-xylulose-5-phosphate reductoisomerase
MLLGECMQTNNLTVLGSTGSIGRQTLKVAKRLGINVVALSCNADVQRLENQAREWKPDLVAIADQSKYLELRHALFGTKTKVISGVESLTELAGYKKADTVMNSIVGIAGLAPTMEALKRSVKLALSNKESLVAAGKLVIEAAKNGAAKIIPVDSEHSAIFQCLNGEENNKPQKIILTASGGPHFGKTKEELQNVSIKSTLAHPKWRMGKKISIDSATLMNKGLEFIEAMHLFDLKPGQIEILIHRQCIVHSAVEFVDGAVIAQLGSPDMEIPIQYALTWPARKTTNTKALTLSQTGTLTFETPDEQNFLCLRAAIKSAYIGGLAPCAVNGANEAAVMHFLDGKLSFLEIGEITSEILKETSIYSGEMQLESVYETDRLAREYADTWLRERGSLVR